MEKEIDCVFLEDNIEYMITERIKNKNIHPKNWTTFIAVVDCSYLPRSAIIISFWGQNYYFFFTLAKKMHLFFAASFTSYCISVYY